MTKAISDVLVTLADPTSPEKLFKQADIVKECTRLLAKDSLWTQAIEQNKEQAKAFHLDSLIGSVDTNLKKIGVTMGAVIMSRVANLELAEVVSEDYSMEKINQTLLKFVLNQNIKMRLHFDDNIDDVYEEFNKFEKKSGKEIKHLNAKLE